MLVLEKYTNPLNEFEQMSVLPKVMDILNGSFGEDKAVSNREITDRLKKSGIYVSQSRIRKIINHIRINCLMPCLLSNSKGYYISYDEKEVSRYVESLKFRSISIMEVARALKKQIPGENLFK